LIGGGEKTSKKHGKKVGRVGGKGRAPSGATKRGENPIEPRWRSIKRGTLQENNVTGPRRGRASRDRAIGKAATPPGDRSKGSKTGDTEVEEEVCKENRRSVGREKKDAELDTKTL